MANFSNKPKNVANYTNRSFGKTDISFDDATFSWNSTEAQTRAWDSKRGDIFANRSKNISSYNNRTKN